MKLLTTLAAAAAVSLTLIPQDANAQRRGYYWVGGYAVPAAVYGTYAAYRPAYRYRAYRPVVYAATWSPYYAYAYYPASYAYAYYPAAYAYPVTYAYASCGWGWGWC